MPPEPPQYDLLPCPGGDVIIVPRGQLCIRLTPQQQRDLGARLPALTEPAGVTAG